MMATVLGLQCRREFDVYRKCWENPEDVKEFANNTIGKSCISRRRFLAPLQKNKVLKNIKIIQVG